MKQIIITMVLLLGAVNVTAQSHHTSAIIHQTSDRISAQSHHTSAIIHQTSEKQELYKAEVRSKLQLDYTMPDFSTSKIDAKVMGPRLAAILTRINDIYTQPTNLSVLSVIQTSQIEGLNYGRIKTMKLDNVSKKGNEIIIQFNTALEPNNLTIKKSQIVFRFNEGVSEDKSTNDFFSNICRYINE